ncbi:hypothetical protein LJC71_05430 [Desulfosarcina sp. OttesenSCG-928-A07]|nr:hypothetical protein [Desulfosarcina sp. OttesenSCG-928-G17]MDL2329178.1 hypothetical protein [Desulfosarcina sp. OttesenSCG-928-A07]
MEVDHKRLLGKWRSAQDSLEDLTLEFKESGQLQYTIHGKDQDHKIFLSYRIENNALITDPPPSSSEAHTLFGFSEEGNLILTYGDQVEAYIRV